MTRGLRFLTALLFLFEALRQYENLFKHHAHLHRQQTIIAPGLFVRSNAERDYASIALFFLRQPSRPNPTRPEAKSGRAAGSGTALTPPTAGSQRRTCGFAERCTQHDTLQRVCPQPRPVFASIIHSQALGHLPSSKKSSRRVPWPAV